MTTDTTSANDDRHLRAAEDPAELLALARLNLAETPTDSLLLAGGGAGGSPPMLTRSSLGELLGPRGREHLARHLALMRERGSGPLRALVVIGDGHQQVLHAVIEEVLRRAGEVLHEVSAACEVGLGAGAGPGPVRVVQGAGAGLRWEVPPPGTSAGEAGMRPRAVGALAVFEDTSAAAGAVLEGRPVPREEAFADRLDELGAGLDLPAVDVASTVDPGALFATVRAALRPLLAAPETLAQHDRMTKCEQVAALLSALAVDRLHWELLAQCVEHGGGREVERATLLQELVKDPERIPHEDVRAGGEWYIALSRLRAIAAAAQRGGTPAARSTARSAWRALTALLVLLAWWNHRFASAGALVDELRAREPESTLAPLLSRMTDTPIFPAWWPST
ncbi:hypothetical protein [Brachybacterium saurashtrense]|uniref:DUF4192 family protein n=1 Tax=Brachybacterium saurashtrense TaxID=556288 RepID=A0A345YM18_9MICO|nr:hypothetical protein [Brachybacterium saurashtrense]AXK44970.1 hypothetical protein DWV08_04650 [Brachybacterium saurashtrense]RRR21654.1 hypothetical protein DXU92_13225 [Brachybacterium saurashtrense]